MIPSLEKKIHKMILEQSVKTKHKEKGFDPVSLKRLSLAKKKQLHVVIHEFILIILKITPWSLLENASKFRKLLRR